MIPPADDVLLFVCNLMMYALFVRIVPALLWHISLLRLAPVSFWSLDEAVLSLPSHWQAGSALVVAAVSDLVLIAEC